MLVLALHVHEVSALVVAAVGVVALALAAIGVRSYRRSASRPLAFVAAAFAALAVKSLVGGWAMWTRALEHEDLELALALADLVVVGLLAAPLLVRSR